MQTREQARRNLQIIATALDSKFNFFGFRFGWDGIVGMIPVIGDITTTLVSAYIVLSAFQLGASLSVLLRMSLNILIDNAVAAVPFAGWFFDFIWRSNLKNLALVDRHLANPQEVSRRSTILICLVLALVTAISTGLAILAAWGLYEAAKLVGSLI